MKVEQYQKIVWMIIDGGKTFQGKNLSELIDKNHISGNNILISYTIHGNTYNTYCLTNRHTKCMKVASTTSYGRPSVSVRQMRQILSRELPLFSIEY